MEVYFDEYDTGRNLWVTKPRTMIEKVAIAQGFRRCFPEEMGGMPYTKDEMGVVTKVIKTDDGSECEVIDEEQMQTPQTQRQTQPTQADNVQICNELKAQIMMLAKKKELTDNDQKLLSNGINNPQNGQVQFKQMITWLQKKADKKQSA